jgi:hypothetical protein
VTVEIPGQAGSGAAHRTKVASWGATIWRRDPAGAWRIAVDISAHIPGMQPSVAVTGSGEPAGNGT